VAKPDPASNTKTGASDDAPVLSFQAGRTLTAVVILCCCILAGLGTWQARKIGPKTAQLAAIETGLSAPAVDLHLLSAPEAYRRVELVLVTVSDQVVPLFGTNVAGKPGHHLYAFGTTDVGQGVVMSLGWVPFAGFQMPTLALADPVRLSGVLVPNPKAGLFTPVNDPSSGSWHLADIDQISAHLGGKNPYPMRLILDGWPGSPKTLGGQVRVDIPNNHREYAFTWFGLMASLIGVYTAYGFQRGRRATE